ncbi:DnaJ C-terminal domain-containing protein [Hirschia baltica]|uniref:Heat shock protein DnaJ domain protein n=1 Tax=Hirschia baltica (strain ATCC 49814 / DSM 5838 / IFAM 1418) TaxID=582402 RepID=C6XIL5_HIRBI|nr:DnaJ C-terminal domain-containing protein [Hirschia baltica]ACT58960.1 heat shock protein DnaJ domain protein [Hirschia baltica ATCC 49814]
MSWDPYAALGVAKSATDKEIKSAYRKLAKELHPDVRPNDAPAEARFKRVSAAFSLLSDPDKRALYDRGAIDADGNEKAPQFRGGYGGGAGPQGFSGRPGADGFNGFSGTHSGGGRAGADVFEDLFGGMFGQGGRARGAAPGGGFGYGASKGADVRYKLEIDFLDAINGARKRVSMADGRSLNVNIPAGVEPGQTLRLKSQGEPGAGGMNPGDALVEIGVRSHPDYERSGKNVRMDLRISLAEAVEGARVKVPTPSGEVSLNIAAGANSGNVLRLKGKGVQSKDKPGDLLVRLLVTLPDKPDADLKDFLKTWRGRDKNVRD